MRAIAAMDADRGIGFKGRIPWRIPADFKWFKEFTWDQTLIVGRTTFDDLPALKNRDIVVLSNTLNNALDKMEYHSKNKHKCRNLYIRSSQDFNYQDFSEAIVAGGTKTYKSLLPLCKDIFISHVMDTYECDAHMPYFEDQFPNSRIVKEYKDFWVVHYWR